MLSIEMSPMCVAFCTAGDTNASVGCLELTPGLIPGTHSTRFYRRAYCFLLLSYLTVSKKSTLWIDHGHVTAFDQFSAAFVHDNGIYQSCTMSRNGVRLSGVPGGVFLLF